MNKKLGETSWKETAFGIIPRSQLIPLEIEGIKKAWDFVLLKRAQGTIPLTNAFFKKIHDVGFGWIFPERRRSFRSREVHVSKHVPPKAYEIESRMHDMLLDIRERMHHLPTIDQPDFLKELITLLAWAHHSFVWIHPFFDYNGRLGRLLINIILLNLSLPPIELKVETPNGRKNYLHALQAADQGDYADLEVLIRAAIEESVRGLQG